MEIRKENCGSDQDVVFHVLKYETLLRIEYCLKMSMLYALSMQSAGIKGPRIL